MSSTFKILKKHVGIPENIFTILLDVLLLLSIISMWIHHSSSVLEDESNISSAVVMGV